MYKNTNRLTTDGQEKSCRKPYTDPNSQHTIPIASSKDYNKSNK